MSDEALQTQREEFLARIQGMSEAELAALETILRRGKLGLGEGIKPLLDEVVGRRAELRRHNPVSDLAR